MSLCGNCKWWGAEGGRATSGVWRSCGRIIHDERFVNSSDERDAMDAPAEDMLEIQVFDANNKAVVEDGSGYYAALKTRESFGCVLHEERVK